MYTSMNSTTALPTKLYMVRVPTIATYSDEELELMGLPVNTLDGENIKNSHNELTTCMLNIKNMIGIYMNGYPIYIVNSADVAEIYAILDDYIIKHTQMSHNSPNVTKVDETWLKEIDKFLNEMFGLNKVNIVTDITRKSTSIGINSQSMPGYMNTNNLGMRVQGNQRNNVEHTPYSGGIMGGYRDENPQGNGYDNNNVYNQPNQIHVDMDKVKRNNVFKSKTVITSANMRDNF